MFRMKLFNFFGFQESAHHLQTGQMMGLTQLEKYNKSRLPNTLAMVMLAISCSGLISFAGLIIISGEWIWMIGELAELITIACLLSARVLLKRELYKPASWLVVVSLLFPILFAWWILGTAVAMGSTFMMPLVLGIYLLDGLELYGYTLFIIIIELGWYIAQHLLRFYKPNIVLQDQQLGWLNMLLIVIVVPGLLVLIRVPSRLQLKSIQNQNEHLQTTLRQLENRYHTGQLVSQSVQSMALQLTGTASQQASGSQEQVVIVNQVYSAVIELSQTANNIEELVSNVGNSANEVISKCQQIELTVNEAASRSQKGQEAIEKAEIAIQMTTQLYHKLLSEMKDLRQKSNNMRVILDLLKSIASQTHLLSLNAAIEAAGAGEHGERFGIVAQEVKNLADRSARANLEVVTIIKQIEESTQIVEGSTEAAYFQAQTIQEAVRYTQSFMGEIKLIASKSREQVDLISQASSSVKELTEVIHAATSQQRTASEQVLQALKGLSVVAEQSAEGSHLISTTADGLEELSQHLSVALAA